MTDATAVRTGFKLVILLGLVSLFADMTYESARSITGPYLALLGATATVVGFVSGLGELLGYGLRYFSGRWVDQNRRYWLMTLLGYGVNLLAIPALALTTDWRVAALLVTLERVGKAIRTPARDAILSYATHALGRGWGFGVHGAMDQTGAILGPLLMSAILAWRGQYHTAFAVLLIPAVLALFSLALGPILYPRPQELEVKLIEAEPQGQNRTFWVYTLAGALLAAGYVDFPLMAFHFKKLAVAPDTLIPVFYAAAMAAEAFASPIIGKWLDRAGLTALWVSAALASLFVPLVFWGNSLLIWVGLILWGLGLAAQSVAMKAFIADLVPAPQRGSAYGVFNMGFGVAWFLGSALMGILYDRSLFALVAFSLICQWLALPLLGWVKAQVKTV